MLRKKLRRQRGFLTDHLGRRCFFFSSQQDWPASATKLETQPGIAPWASPLSGLACVPEIGDDHHVGIARPP
jgi:hypothetical protein